MSEAHIRIDEGIKKGPRKSRKPRRTLQPSAALTTPRTGNGKLAKADLSGILERYLNGEKSDSIAASLNVTRQGLAYYLRQYAEEDWKQAQIILAIEKKEQAEEEMEAADDALSLARAREKLRGAQWDLERLFSRLFGQKQEVRMEVDHRVILDSALQDMAGQLLDRVRTVAEIPNAALLQPDTHSEHDDNSQ